MAGELVVSDERQRRGRVLYDLGVMFPNGDNDIRRSQYLDRINALGIATVDLVEAGKRIEATRETNTYPPLAMLLDRCRDAKRDRESAERRSGDGRAHDARMARPIADTEREHCRQILDLYRAGLVWCPTCRKYDRLCEQHYHEAAGNEPTRHETALAHARLPVKTKKPPLRDSRHSVNGLTPLSDMFGSQDAGTWEDVLGESLREPEVPF